MPTTGFPTRRRTVPTTASFERGKARVTLVVLHDDPRPASEAIGSYTRKGSRYAPHYHIAADGTITKLVPETRAARHSGKAIWQKRRRDIDTISIGVMLEHAPGAPFPNPLLGAAHQVIDRLFFRRRMATEELLRWVTSPANPDAPALIPVILPPDAVFLPGDPDAPDLPPPAYETDDSDGPLVLSGETGEVAQTLWKALAQETFSQRGAGFNAGFAFHLNSDRDNLGAPLSASAKPPGFVKADGKQFGYQVFARDMLFSDITKWSVTFDLHSAMGGKIPEGGAPLALLDAAYRACGTVLFANEPFVQVAVRDRLGFPLGDCSYIEHGGQRYAVQVFSLDTLYLPLAEGQTTVDTRAVRRLSETDPGDLATLLWTITYQPSGAAYDPNSPFHQHAASNFLGAPLSPIYQIMVDGKPYDIQVWALDTLYAPPGGTVAGKNSLPHDAAKASPPPAAPQPVAPATPAPAAPAAPVAGVQPVIAPPPVRSVWLDQHPNAPQKVKNLVVQALALLGYEDSVFDRLPAAMQAMTWGGDKRNRTPGGASYKDICCADYVTLSLSAAGLNFRWKGGDGNGNTRRANYYTPFAGHEQFYRVLGDGEAPLPGDIYVYYGGGPVAEHVNLYMGELSGSIPLFRDGSVVDVPFKPGDNNVLLEASINLVRANVAKNNQPVPLSWYRKKRIVKLRLNELAQAYREAGIGA